MSNSSLALIQCEKFCGGLTSCWGCSLPDDSSLHWDAITDKKGMNRSISNSGGTLTQKPGKSYNHHCVISIYLGFPIDIINYYLYFSLFWIEQPNWEWKSASVRFLWSTMEIELMFKQRYGSSESRWDSCLSMLLKTRFLCPWM